MRNPLKLLSASVLLLLALSDGAFAQQSLDTSHVTRCNPQPVTVGDYALVTRSGITCNATWGASSVPVATLSANGIGRPDGTTISINGAGQYSAIAAPSSINIGSVTTANPHISSDLISGLYSPGANVVGIELGGIKNTQWNTLSSGVDYFSFTPGKSGTPPKLTINGTTANQSLALTATGSGPVTINGVSFSSTSVISSATWGGSVIGSAYISGVYTGITGLGTVTTGTWNGGTIGVAYGGLGITTTLATGKLLGGNAGAYLGYTVTGAGGLTVTTSTGNATMTFTQGAGSISINTGSANQAAYYSATSTISGAPWLTMTTSAVAVAGTLSVTGALTPSQTSGLVGTTTANDAAVGSWGEYKQAKNASGTNFPTTTQLGDASSFSLTAGDWDVSFVVDANANSATVTAWFVGISSTPGNDSSGLNSGDNYVFGLPPISTSNASLTIPAYRMSLSATTSVYGKVGANYSVATPQYRYRLSARRVR